MRRVSVAAVAVASVALLVGVVATPAALAAPTMCTGTLPPGTYQDVTVPNGATCSIDSTDVITGNLSVTRDANLSDNGASIGNNLSADHAASVFVDNSSVGGNLKATATSSGTDVICNTTVGNDATVQQSGSGAEWDIGALCSAGGGLTVSGNLTVQSNAGLVSVGFNTVQGNIDVHNNSGGGSLFENSAGGNCKLANDNPPIVGFANTVAPGKSNTCNQTA